MVEHHQLVALFKVAAKPQEVRYQQMHYAYSYRYLQYLDDLFKRQFRDAQEPDKAEWRKYWRKKCKLFKMESKHLTSSKTSHGGSCTTCCNEGSPCSK